MHALPAHSLQALSRHWISRLAPYREHRNDEHCEALVTDALRFVGVRLESDLSATPYWKDASLARRAAVLLYLVDRGAVVRSVQHGQTVFEATPDAESWVLAQPALTPYLQPTLDLIAALRFEHARRFCDGDR